MHEPDPETPIADTLGALNELVQAGKVREIGCSNFTAEQLREAQAATPPGAAERGHTVLELALAWLRAQRPVASVIAGASAPKQVRANVAAAEWSLSPEDLAGVETALSGV